MSETETLRIKVFEMIANLVQDSSLKIDEKTPLIGNERALDSMKLVELCLQLEDMATELEFEFDWTSATAMSKSRGMFRSAGALAEEFLSQKERKA